MISVGSNVRSCQEPLKKTTIEYLYNALRSPKPEFSAKIRQLRIARMLNPSSYSKLKQSLPYFVCGIFNPPFRKLDNFAYTEYFVIDIDHIEEMNLVLADLKQRLIQDSRTHLCFVSPGGDGLKVVFRFSERCYDTGVYSAFYKEFVKKYSKEMGLEQVLDSVTSDAARACFMSVDESSYFNPNSERVDIKDYIDVDNISEIISFQKNQKAPDVGETSKAVQSNKESEKPQELPDDVYAAIRQKLNPKAPKVREHIVVPAELENIEEGLKKYMCDLNIEVLSVRNINYGKTIRAVLGMKTGEVNIFYGKRGFSIVKSTKSGTSLELNELLKEVVESYLRGE